MINKPFTNQNKVGMPKQIAKEKFNIFIGLFVIILFTCIFNIALIKKLKLKNGAF